MDVALVGGAETLALDCPTQHKEPGRHELPPLESQDTVQPDALNRKHRNLPKSTIVLRPHQGCLKLITVESLLRTNIR